MDIGKRVESSTYIWTFGENITISGMCEEDVCIGDTFQIGEAIVQVTQPRQPCFKLARNTISRSYHYIFKKQDIRGFIFAY